MAALAALYGVFLRGYVRIFPRYKIRSAACVCRLAVFYAVRGGVVWRITAVFPAAYGRSEGVAALAVQRSPSGVAADQTGRGQEVNRNFSEFPNYFQIGNGSGGDRKSQHSCNRKNPTG